MWLPVAGSPTSPLQTCAHFQRAQDRQAADLMERMLAGSRPAQATTTKQ